MIYAQDLQGLQHMGQQLYPPGLVKLIVGMLSSDRNLFDLAEKLMESTLGTIDIRSGIMPFTYSDYYKKEMGSNLLRKFISFRQLIDPYELGKIKHSTNALELQLANSNQSQAESLTESLTPIADRPINLDPGYIEPSKLVLATTKNYSHRVYIGNSMYAETTLSYSKGAWHPWPFTYPDYASGSYDNFLNQARSQLMEQRSSHK